MTIAVDFDGTLCKRKYPNIGEPNEALIEWLILCRLDGDKIILWTCREDELLDDAVRWCSERGLDFDAINENVDGSDCRKVHADLYIDDKSRGYWWIWEGITHG